jgi:hypothetical protein
MKDNVLVTNKKYSGKYVALKSFFDKHVVASGNDPVKVVASAKKKGYLESVILFVPGNDTIHVF